MKKLMMVSLIALAAVSFAAGASVVPVELTAEARMNSRTKDRKRDPGLFGDYWWANRFLSRHQQIEKFRNQTIDLVLMGDSIMHFWEVKHKASWQKFTAGRKVLNCGYGGDCTQHVIWRIEHGELDGYRAKVVMLMIGTNNNSHDKANPTNVAAGVEKIVSMIRTHQPAAQIVLLPIFPRGDSATSKHAVPRARNEATNKLLKDFAAKDGKLIWIDFNDKLTDESGWVPRTLMADEIHPTDAGYDIWMAAINPTLEKIWMK